MALQIVQRPPSECLFIDDRRLNLESAGALGMRTLLFESAEQLRRDLGALGLAA